MKNALVGIVILAVLLFGLGYLAYRLGVSNCREDYTTQANKVQQMVQESDRAIREKVYGTASADNLDWLCKHWKRAD